jgi:hypothetical protein
MSEYLEQLKAKLRVRQGKQGWGDSVEKIKKEIERLENGA